MRDGTEPIQKFLLDARCIIDLDDKVQEGRRMREKSRALLFLREIKDIKCNELGNRLL